MSKFDDENKESYFLKRLHSRCERLLKLVSLNAPGVIIGRAAYMVCEAAGVVHEHFWVGFGSMITETLVAKGEFCALCGVHDDVVCVEYPLCIKCMEEGEKNDPA